MHEFTITKSLINQVLSEAKRVGAKRVNKIKVLLGENSAVVPDCLQFYFDRLKEGTLAEGATLEFRRVPLRVRCPKCGKEFSSIEAMCDCNAGGEILAGDELVIESIEVLKE
ncbi:MAG: hydrogenase maturation nickel metallochaperone HypA [candidate division WOR-3 bacterium]